MNQFGVFLVQQGLARPEHVVKALDRQREQQTPLGKIAVAYRLISMNQLFDILNRGADSNLRFGEIAVSLGYLTREKVGMLLEVQRQRRPMLGEILVEMGVVDREHMDGALRQFSKKKSDAGRKDESVSVSQHMRI